MSFYQVYDPMNLLRAYRWILSNPEPAYKLHFRDAYSDYALSSAGNIKFLRRQISQDRYTPTQASKLYIPKTSGILRPISLLTINDQVAYQAIANVVAEQIYKRTQKRYRKNVFQHLYAGKSSRFFYLKWQDNYRAYRNSVVSNFADGYRYVATFDLTAFYDSIDHNVLRTFLKDLRVNQDVIDLLLRCLREWTCATWGHGRSPIYIEHGIPQGPLSSGLISEVVLRHLDDSGTLFARDIRYLRYVDDIKIMARTEESLRRRLVLLDLASKEIGLFPQTSKVAIRKIGNPTDEVKTVSDPNEPSVRTGGSQAQIRIRIRTLANRGKPVDLTRFKFVLASLDPTAKTNALLRKVLLNSPFLSGSLARHWAKYNKLPGRLADSLFNLAKASEVYHSVNAQLLDLLFSRSKRPLENDIADFAYERLFARKYRRKGVARPQPTYKAALVRWALLSGRMTFRDFQGLLAAEQDWWVRQKIIRYVSPDRFGSASYAALLNEAMRVKGDPELPRAASALLFQSGANLLSPHSDCSLSARLLLRSTKVIASAGAPPSMISPAIRYMLRIQSYEYDWQKFFGSDHRAAEQIVIKAKQRFETDIDACVVVFDSFCDMVLQKMYEKNGSSMTSSYGNAVGTGAPAWLRALPRLKKGFFDTHQLRIRSFTAHPKYSKTGSPNTRIRHAQFYKIRKALIAAFDELAKSVAP